MAEEHLNSNFEDVGIEGIISGFQRLSPSAERTFKPSVPSSITPVVGMVFSSLDAAYEFYQIYAKKGGFCVRKGSQTEKNGFIAYKYYTCSKEGHKPFKKFDGVLEVVKDGKKPRKGRNRPSIRTGCNAHIALYSDDGKSYNLYRFVEQHNHTLISQEDMQFVPSSRNLTVMKQKRIYSLSTLNLGPVKSFNIMRTEYGGFEEVGATAVDCKNFKRDLNCFIEEYDAEMIVQRLTNKKEYLRDFSFEYTVDSNGCLTGLFWADEVSKQNYLVFGDVISFDATFKTNKYKMVFVPFTGIDNHFHNVNLGAGLIAKETTESYVWLLTCFLNAFGHQPKVVVTDQDAAMKAAIETVFTDSRHRLCMWHIMKKVADKVGNVLCNDDTFKRRVCNIVWTDAIEPEMFEKEWQEIIHDFGLLQNIWLESMFDLRSMWIPAFYRDEPMSGLMRTTSRSESENQFFGSVSNSQLTLVEFFSHFDMAIEAQRYNHRKNDHDTRNTEYDNWTDSPLEVHAHKLYTRAIFFDVQEEILASFEKCFSVNVKEEGENARFFIRDISAFGNGFFEVLAKVDDEFSASCSCKRFEQYGLLCRHVFLVIRMFEIEEIPEKYILRRWRREAVRNRANCSFFAEDSSNVNIDEANQVVREIMLASECLCNRFFSNNEELIKIRDELKGMIQKADESSKTGLVFKKKDMMASLLGYNLPSTSTVKLPPGIRNKGRGSHRRIKSKKEKAASRMGKRHRGCKVCGMVGHDIRTCSALVRPVVEGAVSTDK
ncbi:protein FAR1-RELATED SEQUENCE 5-like [Helianthus annuus]|uniref:protein FAR1-RELATED SEQUENCE 5-like n=1 Tax=Helianthus annuus TaxID=4232 RepID=UPI000B8F5770|nr:protein FAR1-RELATED SEQUENCE 5-like [Helianthus annuus]